MSFISFLFLRLRRFQRYAAQFALPNSSIRVLAARSVSISPPRDKSPALANGQQRLQRFQILRRHLIALLDRLWRHAVEFFNQRQRQFLCSSISSRMALIIARRAAAC